MAMEAHIISFVFIKTVPSEHHRFYILSFLDH